MRGMRANMSMLADDKNEGCMPELRKHYFLDEYCIVSEKRKKRPSDFVLAKTVLGDKTVCPFCPGNEKMTPPAVAVYRKHDAFSGSSERISLWQLRVFPNAFATMVECPAPATSEWIALPGQGFHEVIVDSPQHGEDPADFALDHMEKLIQVYRDRYIHYCGNSLVKYVSVFKNWGMEAGASLSHSHSQLVTLPILPPQLKRELYAISCATRCPFCNIVAQEKESCRLIEENENWILIAPFYSQAPYETWILPKRHFANLREMNEAEGKNLAALLKQALGGMRSVLNDPSYNCMIFQLPFGYHLNLRIQPAISKIAGFERGTGIYINSIAPEQAAEEFIQKLNAGKS
jgi:UDPglucose--hexose-1-phosphate uridylyltransferase